MVRKLLKSVFVLMLTFVMTAGLMMLADVQPSYAAAKKVKAKSITLNHKTYTLKKGGKLTLKASIKPKNSTQKKVVWTSSNKKIATVKNGKVKALKRGKVTITAKVKGTKKTAKATIYVGTPAKKARFTDSAITIEEGQTVTEKATISPAKATVKTVKYSSSDKSVATVNSKGVITARSEGVAVITATPKDEACKKATLTVTVTKLEKPVEMKVAVITDGGDISDQSFNQTIYESCRDFCSANGLSFTYKKPADFDEEKLMEKTREAIDEGYTVIAMPGFMFANVIYSMAPKYPDVKFIGLDMSEDDVTGYGERSFNADNVFCAVFSEEKAGYMAGYAAVKLGYKKLGFLGGFEIPAIQRYGYGFIQGADAAAKEGGVEGVEMKYGYGGQFFGDDDITAAMDAWYSEGTECVFACGGNIFTSAAEAASKTGGKIIGVDTDQGPMIDEEYGKGITVTSAMKDLGSAATFALSSIEDGKWDECKGFGYIGEGMLPDSTQWSDSFTKADYEKLRGEIESGKRSVSADTESMPATGKVTVTEVKIK